MNDDTQTPPANGTNGANGTNEHAVQSAAPDPVRVGEADGFTGAVLVDEFEGFDDFNAAPTAPARPRVSPPPAETRGDRGEESEKPGKRKGSKKRAARDEDDEDDEDAKASADEDDEDQDDQDDQDDDKPKKKKSHKGLIIGGIVAAVLLAIGLAVGIPWYIESQHWATTDDAFIDTHAQLVAPRVSGRVNEVLVDDNQMVKAGDTLVVIDPSDYKAMLDQASAAVLQAQAQLAQSKAQLTVTKANAEQAKAQVEVAQTDFDNAETNLKRYQNLSDQAVSRQTLTNAEATAKSAQASLQSSQKQASAAEAQVGYVDSQIQAAEAGIKSAQAQLEQARLQLDYTTVKAMVDGRITRKQVSPGNYATTGTQIMAIVPQDVWVTANYKETELGEMRVGQSVEISVDALPDHKFQGKVDSIQSGTGARFSLLPPQNATGNYVKVVQRIPVKITFDDTSGEFYQRLSPGMSVVPSVRIK